MRTDTLYMSDLDGTLLSTDSQISQRSAHIITDLTECGAKISVATARTPATVVPLLAGVRIDVPAVVMTGCATWDRNKGHFEDAFFLSAEEVRTGVDVCERYGISPFVYVMAEDGRCLDVYHTLRHLNKAEESFYNERARLRLKTFHIGTPPPARAYTHTMLFYAMGTDAAIAQAAEELSERTRCTICCYPDIFNPAIQNLEIFPVGVSKAAAVLRVKERVGVKRLVVFGDSNNDLSMFAVADVAVAVGNALPAVKDAATVVIEPNYTDSVARFIEQD